MINSKIIKLKIAAHIIFEDNDEILGETITQSIDIYRGQELNNDFIKKLEELALQNFINSRPEFNR